MRTLLGKTFEEERQLINELAGLPPIGPEGRCMEVCPDAVVLGSRWFDIVIASVLMSGGVWFPMSSIAKGTYVGGIEVTPNQLKCAGKYIGKNGGVYVKYTIGGRPGAEIAEQARAFIKTQIRPFDKPRRDALDQLVGIYLDAKEESKKRFKDFRGAVAIGG